MDTINIINNFDQKILMENKTCVFSNTVNHRVPFDLNEKHFNF